MSRFLLAAAVWFVAAVAHAQPATDQPLTRIAFGSCADQDKPCPAWESIARLKPELLVLLGDTIYADLDKSKQVTPDLIRSKYDTLNRVAAFQGLRESARLMAVWDDHDYGKNDAGAEWELKDESQQILLDFLGVPKDSPRRTRKGVYHAEVFGPPGKRVQVILLDGRYHRSKLEKGKFDPRLRTTPYLPNTAPDATILGEEQWRWLAEQLKVPAELRLIGSGVQVLSEEHAFEKWMNFPKERERLFNLLRETKANGVIFLSGDRHLAELSVAVGAVSYPLYDVTSSGLNQATPSWRAPEKNKYRVAGMPFGHNFGYIAIDWSSETSPRVSLELRDEAGEVAVRHPIRLGLLTPADGKAAAGKPRPAGVLSPAEALTKVGEEVTVQFEVKAARRVGGRLFLNSEPDFRDEKNFTVMLAGPALAGKYKAAAGEAFQGKTVRVKGKVTEYQKRPQIEVADEKQVEVVE